MRGFLERMKHPPLSQKEQSLLADRLSLLLGASLPLSEAVGMMADSFGKARKPLFEALRRRLEEGGDFAEALSESRLGLSRMLVMSARVGGRSGTLGEALRSAEEQIARRLAARSTIISAATYPAIVFAASLGIICFLVFFIMPKILPTVESLHVPLPLVTRFFMAVSHGLARDWWRYVLGVAAFGMILHRFYRRSLPFRRRAHYMMLRVPVLSSALRSHAVSESFDAVSALLAGGCPLAESAEEAADFTFLIPYRTALRAGAEEVKRGIPFSAALGRHPSLFPALAVQGLSIGERTGELQPVFARLSRFYARELETALASFSRLIEPALMAGVGIIVGAAALSIVMPVYEISQHIGK